jgi:hypothetical protein
MWETVKDQNCSGLLLLHRDVLISLKVGIVRIIRKGFIYNRRNVALVMVQL